MLCCRYGISLLSSCLQHWGVPVTVLMTWSGLPEETHSPTSSPHFHSAAADLPGASLHHVKAGLLATISCSQNNYSPIPSGEVKLIPLPDVNARTRCSSQVGGEAAYQRQGSLQCGGLPVKPFIDESSTKDIGAGEVLQYRYYINEYWGIPIPWRSSASNG